MTFSTTKTVPTRHKQGWVLWHPEKGFGHYVEFSSFMDDAVNDCQARCELEGDRGWKVRQAKVVLED
jgi:hypothetical protein